MSLKIHRQVMNISRRNGFDLSLKAWALLIAMTDRADDGGNSIYASIPNLGTTARLNKRTAFRAKDELLKAGLINAEGKRPHRNGHTISYRINLAVLKKLEEDSLDALGRSIMDDHQCQNDTSDIVTPVSDSHQCQGDSGTSDSVTVVPVSQCHTKQSLKQSRKQSERKAASASSNSKSKSETPHRGDIQQKPVQPENQSPELRVKVPAQRKRFDPMSQFTIVGREPRENKSPVRARKESVPSAPAASHPEQGEFWQTWVEDLEDDEGVIKADEIRRAIRFFSDPDCGDTWYRDNGWSKRLVKSNARRMLDAVPFDYDPDRVNPKPHKKPSIPKGDPNCKKCRGAGIYTVFSGCNPHAMPCEICNPKLAAWVASLDKEKAA